MLINDPKKITNNLQFYKMVTDNVAEGIILADLDFNIIYANKVAIKIFNADKDLLIGNSFKSIAPDFVSGLLTYNYQVTEFTMVTTLFEKMSGEELTLKIFSTPSTLDGKDYLILYLTDLSEIKKSDVVHDKQILLQKKITEHQLNIMISDDYFQSAVDALIDIAKLLNTDYVALCETVPREGYKLGVSKALHHWYNDTFKKTIDPMAEFIWNLEPFLSYYKELTKSTYSLVINKTTVSFMPKELIFFEPFQSMLSFPIWIQGKFWGHTIICRSNYDDPYTDYEISIANSISMLAGIGIHYGRIRSALVERELILKNTLDKTTKSDKIKTELIASFSKDITPSINYLLELIAVVEDNTITKDKHSHYQHNNNSQSHYITLIKNSTKKILSIIDNTLALNNIYNNDLIIEKHEFLTFLEFESLAHLFVNQESEYNMKFNFFIDPKIPIKLIGDYNKIKQIMIYIISSAIKLNKDNNDISVDIVVDNIEENICTLQLSIISAIKGLPIKEIDSLLTDRDTGITSDVESNEENIDIKSKIDIMAEIVTTMDGKYSITSNEEDTIFNIFIPLEIVNIEEDAAIKSYISNALILFNENINMPKQQVDLFFRYISRFELTYKLFSTVDDIKKLDQKPKFIFFYYTIDCYDLLDNILNEFPDIDILITVLPELSNQLPHLRNNVKDIIFIPFQSTNIYSTILGNLNFNDNINIAHIVAPYSFQITFDLKILVIEENKVSQEIIRLILKQFNIQPQMVSSDTEAIELLNKEPFDVIFININMLGIDTVNMINKIKSIDTTLQKATTTIVALTTNTSKESIDTYLKSGINECLPMPLAKKSIYLVLKKLFSNKFQSTPSNISSFFDIQNISSNLSIDIEAAWVLIDTFVSSFDKTIESINISYQSKNYGNIITTIQKFRALASKLDFNNLANICKDIEEKLTGQNKLEALTLINKFSFEIDNLSILYKYIKNSNSNKPLT